MPTQTPKRRRWTSEDELDLTVHYVNHTVKELAKMLHRSEYAITAKLSALGLHKRQVNIYIRHEQPVQTRKNWFQRLLDRF